MRLYHGSNKPFAAHVGLCLTDDQYAARDYAPRGTLTTVEFVPFGLVVERARSFGEAGDDGCCDSARETRRYRRRGVDVVEYQDQSPDGRTHRTWRLISRRALRAITTI